MLQQFYIFGKQTFKLILIKILIPWRKIKVNAPKVSLFAIFVIMFLSWSVFLYNIHITKEKFWNFNEQS